MADTKTASFAIRRYLLVGGAEPVPVTTPIACNYVGWVNYGTAVAKVMTEPYDDTSWMPLNPSGQGTILGVPAGPLEIRLRFRSGEEICRLQLDSEDSETSTVVCVQFVF